MTVILRRTEKLASLLPVTGQVPEQSDTALGDWYVNRLVVDRRPLLLLVSALSLLPLVVPARNVRLLPTQLSSLVRHRLQSLDVSVAWIDAEIAAMGQVAIATTASRSVLGVMNSFAQTIPYLLVAGGWDDTTLDSVAARLALTPMGVAWSPGKYVWPLEAAPARLREKWGGA